MSLMPENQDKATFDSARRAQLQRRAAKRRARLDKSQFIFERIAQDMADRLLMINRRFQNALLIAPSGFEQLFRQALAADKTPEHILSTPHEQLGPTLGDKHEFDLIILCMSHQAENNPVGLFTALKARMVDDGHIISVCLGGDSLSALRHVLYEMDQKYFGGISPRIHPMMDMQPNVGLLAHTGFKLTMGDRDTVKVSYKRFSTFISDLRDMGESYAVSVKSTSTPHRRYWRDVERALKTKQDKFEIIYDILWASGWTPHDSQQKPLKPGSATTHLSAAFKSK